MKTGIRVRISLQSLWRPPSPGVWGCLFVVFVAAGGLLALRRPRAGWLHLPALAWGVVIEFMRWIRPLTPLENALRRCVGEAGYGGSFGLAVGLAGPHRCAPTSARSTLFIDRLI